MDRRDLLKLSGCARDVRIEAQSAPAFAAPAIPTVRVGGLGLGGDRVLDGNDRWQDASAALAEFEHPSWKEIAAQAHGRWTTTPPLPIARM
ncbi:MAG TPA: hypothetical protein VFK57_23765 [Vicinamibacterales bacterium]|nr:hypothetical protein [Vicinamibacterales bacterium]